MAKKTIITNSTEFSRCITDYIGKSGFTVYKIAQITGLDRTAIQHAMSGRFVPQREFFEKLCSVFIITPQQKAELTELYYQAKVGIKLYSERKHIQRIIENLPQYYINTGNVSLQITETGLINEKSVTGLLNVNQAMINIINRELNKDCSQIATTIPFDNKLFYNVILQTFTCCKNETVFEHYMRIFRSDNENSDGNLTILENMLKMSMNAGVVYKPYSYYAYKEAVDDHMPVFPYCLITSEYLVMVSENFQAASVIDDKGVVEIAKQHIEKLKQNSTPMIEMIDNSNMFEIFAMNSRLFDKSLEFQPCLTKYLTLDIVMKRLKDMPQKEIIINALKDSFFTAEGMEITNNQQAVNVFVKKGLEHFAQTGVMVNLHGHLLEAMSVEERIYMLEAMKADVGKYYLMLDESRVSLPDFIQIIYLNNQSCLISCLMEDKKFCCLINERSLSLSMEDFIRSLYETGMTVDSSEVIKVIDECIENLNRKQNEV